MKRTLPTLSEQLVEIINSTDITKGPQTERMMKVRQLIEVCRIENLRESKRCEERDKKEKELKEQYDKLIIQIEETNKNMKLLEEENQRLTKEENELIDQIGKIKKNKEEYEQKIKECQEKYLQRVENDKKMKEYQQIIDDATKEYTESQTTRQMADKEIMDINKNHDFKKEIKYLTQHLQRLKSEPNVDDQIKMKEDYVEKLTKDCGLVECDHQPEKYRLNQRIKELEEQKVLFQKNLNELNAKMAAPMFDEKKDDAFGSLF